MESALTSSPGPGDAGPGDAGFGEAGPGGEWSHWLGRTTTSTAVLDPLQADRMAATLGQRRTLITGDRLPPAWHWLFFHDLTPTDELGSDGHPRGGAAIAPSPVTQRMWAGGRLTFDAAAHLGDTATRTSTISRIDPKEGRTGPLCFVTVDHEVAVGGTVRIREQQMLVYKGPGRSTEASAEAAPTDPQFTVTHRPCEALLFRYSALTFNSHRIHYDVDYARDVEGYPGLVVHGPLLATLLMGLSEASGRSLSTFDYRARSPLFLPHEFSVNGRRDGSTAQLWASSHDGRLAMSATATYRQD